MCFGLVLNVFNLQEGKQVRDFVQYNSQDRHCNNVFLSPASLSVKLTSVTIDHECEVGKSKFSKRVHAKRITLFHISLSAQQCDAIGC